MAGALIKSIKHYAFAVNREPRIQLGRFFSSERLLHGTRLVAGLRWELSDTKSQPRTGHTREPDPTNNALKHTTTRKTAIRHRWGVCEESRGEEKKRSQDPTGTGAECWIPVFPVYRECIMLNGFYLRPSH